MATKYGQDAINAWDRTSAKFKTRIKTIAVIIIVGVIWAVLEYTIFA